MYAQTLVQTTSNGSIELDDMELSLLIASSESSLYFQKASEMSLNTSRMYLQQQISAAMSLSSRRGCK